MLPVFRGCLVSVDRSLCRAGGNNWILVVPLACLADLVWCAEWPQAQPWQKAMALTLLAAAYCRSGRVLLAEGLLREASKKLRLTREGLCSTWHPPHGCHASCAAHVAWQHAQLLTALPKRSTEAQQWADVGHKLWEVSQSGQNNDGMDGRIENVFGDLEAFTGKGRRGKGHVIVFLLGRMYAGPVELN
jgi:hypothetical protein